MTIAIIVVVLLWLLTAGSFFLIGTSGPGQKERAFWNTIMFLALAVTMTIAVIVTAYTT